MRPSLVLLFALLPLSLATGCKNDEEKAADLQSDYYTAVCRLYSEPACVQSMEDSCGFTLSFDSSADCVMFMTLFTDAECDLGAVLLEHEDDATACIDSMESFDCATEDICGADGEFLDQAGDCAAITAAVEQACPGSGTTGGTSSTM